VNLAEIYNTIPEEGFRILFIIEGALTKYEYVPVGYIASKTRYPPKKLDLLLGLLNSKKLVQRRIGRDVGYKLTFKGLDVIAIYSLVRRGVIKAIGDKIRVGKESDIYEALGPGDVRYALKLHRVGRTSFKRTVLLRPYVLEKESPNWLQESKLSAQREYRILGELIKHTSYVPKPIAYSRHCVVTEFIEGIELYKVRAISDPLSFMKKVLQVVDIAYNNVGIVHGDLSEYNILVRYPDEEPVIIDWPQYVYKEHPSSKQLLERDVYYVVRYFNRRFGIKEDWRKYFERIINKGET
jgi:RIO kinase 2